MAGNLPLELISLIAKQLHHDGYSLAQFTIVCRQWQAAFEPFIYSKLVVYSEEVEDVERREDAAYRYRKLQAGCEFKYRFFRLLIQAEATRPKKNVKKELSLARFRTITSGAGAIRRSWVHELKYKIVVPYLLEDWRTVKERNYCQKNSMREANDGAFRTGIVSLFESLSSWSQRYRISLQLSLFGRDMAAEPYTRFSDVGYDHWQSTESKSLVRPYRASFPDNDASILLNVSCINQVSFHNTLTKDAENWNHRIWAGTVFQIIAHCPTVTCLNLDLNDFVRPEHKEYMVQRRQALAEGLQKVPNTLRKFHYRNSLEEPEEEYEPALNILLSQTDIFATELRQLSFRLQELKLSRTSLSLDFLFPLDDDLRPTADAASLWWPNMENLEFDLVPSFLPSGEWLFSLTPEFLAGVARMDDMYDVHQNPGKRKSLRKIMHYEAFHRLFASMGYAAQRMPRLSTIKFDIDHGITNEFSFYRDQPSGIVTAEWQSHSLYIPDERVTTAWGVGLDDIKVKEKEVDWHSSPLFVSTITYLSWPPEEGE